MDVILIESVSGLGRPGDHVAVRPGFANNFLFPKRKAVPVSADALRAIPKLRVKAEEEERALIASMKDLAHKLSGFGVEVKARATEEGHLFGSVTDKDVQSALEAAGWQIPHRAVRLDGHLKEAGTHEVEVHLYADIETTVQVVIVPVDGEGGVIDLSAAAAEDEQAGTAPAADEAPAPDEASAAS